MLMHSEQVRRRANQALDGALFAAALGLAYGLRASVASLNLPELEDFRTYLWLFPLVALTGPVMLAAQGFYRDVRPIPRLAVILIIFRGCAFTVIALILLLFLLREQFARSVILLVGGFGGLFVYARYEFVQWLTRNAQPRRRVLWIGHANENQLVASHLSGWEKDALEPTGEWQPAHESIDPLVERLHRDHVNTVIISLPGLAQADVETTIARCETEGVEVFVRPGLTQPSPYRMAVGALAGEVVLHVRPQAVPPLLLVAKQLMDLAGATMLLVLFLPLMVLIGVAVRLTSRGPAIYRHQRAGLNGRPFTMLKFRSMSVGADAQQQDYAQDNTLKGPVFKHAADPRVTKLGRFLRRHSLDELPQLWNVLRGEMSLVGPRPLPLAEAAAIAAGHDRRRMSVRPGMTGLWQISGRSDLADFADWVRLDLAYIDQWSLWLDLKILLATIPVALLGRGGR